MCSIQDVSKCICNLNIYVIRNNPNGNNYAHQPHTHKEICTYIHTKTIYMQRQKWYAEKNCLWYKTVNRQPCKSAPSAFLFRISWAVYIQHRKPFLVSDARAVYVRFVLSLWSFVARVRIRICGAKLDLTLTSKYAQKQHEPVNTGLTTISNKSTVQLLES